MTRYTYTNIMRFLRRKWDEAFYPVYYKLGLYKRLVNKFHRVYYNSHILGKTWKETKWLGANVLKTPMDLVIYQEIIFDKKPDVIIECGTCYGGSTLFFASICDLVGKGRIISVDIDDKPHRPKHERITYVHGSSTDEKIVDKVKSMIKKGEKVMVILDSDHSKEHVLNEMKIYDKITSKGQYMVVEDSNINGHPAFPHYGPGPMEAIKEYMKKNNKDFIIDKSKEKLLLTFNPSGYLLKIK